MDGARRGSRRESLENKSDPITNIAICTWERILVVEEETRDERRTQRKTAPDERGIYLPTYRTNLHDTQCHGPKVDSQVGGGRRHNGTVVQYGKGLK